jgi:hypothetical protein
LFVTFSVEKYAGIVVIQSEFIKTVITLSLYKLSLSIKRNNINMLLRLILAYKDENLDS